MTLTEPTQDHTPNGTGAYFRDIADAALARRTVLGGALGLTVAAAGTATPAAADAGATLAGRRGGHRSGDSPLRFHAIAPVPDDVDDVTVPRGFRWQPVIRWGDPILPGAPVFDVNNQTPEAQAAQFGYNCDYLDILVTGQASKKAVLVCNHEYTNEDIMFPPGTPIETQARVGIEAHGFSIVELSRTARKKAWSYVPDGALNRRITGSTPIAVDGPAAGSDLLKTAADPTGTLVLGTLNNCSGGTTPWGTILTAEENIDQYFYCEGTSPEETRYTLGPQDERQWRTVDPRFDATNPDYRNEPNRFGWIVEIDPHDPTSTPVKHTALGRFKHEAATIRITTDGRVAAYSGDDQRFDYVYKFVSWDTYTPGSSDEARQANKTLLSEGDLYVAVFSGDGMEDGVSDGTGRWIPLVEDGASQVPGMSVEEVLVYTRIAADQVGATKMDRPEDVQPSPTTGHVYIACTNNTQRGTAGNAGVDEANPRADNKDGHVIELIEDGGNSAATTFSWNLLLVCGNEHTAGTYFGGWDGPVSPISCPDNLAFDSAGVLWISTDGQPGTIGQCDALHMVPVTGDNRGQVQQFLAVPAGAETCGPVIHDKDESVFVAVQHPGENGSWNEPTSRFPDFVKPGAQAPVGDFAGPRPTVVQVTRR